MGSYFLTMNPKKDVKENDKLPLIGCLEEALSALHEGVLNLHDWIDMKNPDKGKETLFGITKKSVVRTTVGRGSYSILFGLRN